MKHRRASYTEFIGIPRKVANSPAFRSLPPIARALYFDLRRQHNGYNNGQIAAVDRGNDASPGLAYYGWSHSTVHKNLKILLERLDRENTARRHRGDVEELHPVRLHRPRGGGTYRQGNQGRAAIAHLHAVRP